MRAPFARLGYALTLAGLLGADLPDTARADNFVQLSNGAISVAQAPSATSTQPVNAIIEPFRDCCRNGFRVRQQQSGDPALRAPNRPECFENRAANDVVCNGARSSASVTGGAGIDRITFLEFSDPGDDPLCTEHQEPRHKATLTLGSGNDRVDVGGTNPCPPGGIFPDRTFLVFLDVTAQGGDDAITGGNGADKFDGGGGADTLVGGGGNDSIFDSAGDDTSNGGAGDDVLIPGSGADILFGGGGTDTVDYSSRLNPVSVFLGSLSGDGEAGEDDEIKVDVEIIKGGFGDDTMSGDDGVNQLFGLSGDDFLVGNNNPAGTTEVLDGGFGNDLIRADAGFDQLRGGPDNDRLLARDAAPDSIDCGSGLADEVSADSQDPSVKALAAAGCETISREPLDDKPGGHAVGRRFDRGARRVRIACPRRAGVDCAGRLVLRDRRGRVVGRAGYAVARGRRTAVEVGLRRRVRRGERLSAQLTEPGVSKIGPRSTAHQLIAR